MAPSHADKSAPGLQPLTKKGKAQFTAKNWIEMPLKGNTAIDFERQIEVYIRQLEEKQIWDVKHTAAGNPVPRSASVLVLYREDQRFSLDNILPRQNAGVGQSNNALKYDLVIASQPFRSRASAESKCKNVLMPMLGSLKRNGRLCVIQSTGHDPGMEIVRNAWPEEVPFATPGHVLQAELIHQMKEKGTFKEKDFKWLGTDQFKFELHSLPDEAAESLGTSAEFAAWNAACYVAQIEDTRSDQLVLNGTFQSCVHNVLNKYGNLWFTNEAFVVVKK